MARVVEVTTPAAEVASSWYERERPVAFSLVMPVTTSTAVVPRAWRPALVPPEGAARLAERVTPVGIVLPIEAVILAPLWLVVTAQVLPLEVTLVGAPPATAAEMVMDGVPVTATWLIASICSVTVCVAVCAAAEAAAAITRRPLMIIVRELFIVESSKGVVFGRV